MGYWSELRAFLLKDPAKLIRYLVLFVCCIVVIVQLYECFTKLYSPPISTHSYYNLNETIEMPAVTICREPPYKEDVLTHTVGTYCPHPKFTPCWNKYPHKDVNLEEVFKNATFNATETFFQYGLDGCAEHVELTTSMHFNYGLCYTLTPKKALKRATKDNGYSLILTHHVNNTKDSHKYFEKEPGWHIFIHDLRENFTEINMKGSGRVEYVFCEINEEIEIKLQTQIFSNIETREKACAAAGYSDLKCGELCIYNDLIHKSNCSGPWMQDITIRQCDDSESMKNLTIEYQKFYENEYEIDCDCKLPCESRLYSTYIQNRKPFNQPDPYTQVWIYYTTKLISMVEERPSYDATQFIADVGGSLGFLLGLSVLGLIGILEHLTLFFCGGVIRNMQMKHEKRMQEKEADEHSQSSDDTVDIAVICKSKELV